MQAIVLLVFKIVAATLQTCMTRVINGSDLKVRDLTNPQKES